MVFHRNCLILSPYPDQIADIIETTGDKAKVSDSITGHPDWIISYGHRSIVREPYLTVFRDRIINLHISYLPWGRGADPNLWAWMDDEPHGVTLHYVDSGIDTGDIIAQKLVTMAPDETLATSYARLHREMIGLFRETWPLLRNGHADRMKQPEGGSYHRLSDRNQAALTHGWDTPTRNIARTASPHQTYRSPYSEAEFDQGPNPEQ